jgi:quercetin dioxygenase-like cupin family protein
MAQAGDVLTSSIEGKERLLIRQSGAETGGALLEIEAIYRPNGAFPPLHAHPEQDEHFTVLEGAVAVRTDRGERVYGAGSAFSIPRGMPHTMRNGGDEEARVLWQTRPALQTLAFYETLYGLALDGKTNAEGMPGLLQLAVILRDYRREFALSSPPRAVQAVLFGALAFLGTLRGYRGRYRRYGEAC